MTIPLRRAMGAEDDAARLAVTCYQRPWRLVAATLVLASRLGVALVLARIALADPPLTFPQLLGLVTTLVVVPAALAALLARASRATMTGERDTIVVARRDVRIEVPAHAIIAVEPWGVPLPTPGLSLRLRSGRRLAYDLGVEAPRRIVAFLAARTGTGALAAADDPGLVYGDAGSGAGTLRWWQWIVKFPLLALLPTGVLFRAHQWIAYGGTFGEYYQYGARAYALTFLVYWTTITIYVALWAGCWRMLAELVVWGASRIAPAAVPMLRRIVEVACRLVYYGGVPLLLALRFME